MSTDRAWLRCRSATPHLVVRGAESAIEFYKKAFTAEVRRRAAAPDGKLAFVELQIGDARVFLNDEFLEAGVSSPEALHGTPVTIHLYVDDADLVFEQAVNAGAAVLMPLEDQPWGERYGIVRDPFGHRWSIASHVRDRRRDRG